MYTKAFSIVVILLLASFILSACGSSLEITPSLTPTFMETSDSNSNTLPTETTQINTNPTHTPVEPSPTPSITATPDVETPTPTATTQSPSPSPTPAYQTQIPNPDQYTWQVINDRLAAPIGFANAGDGSGRLFVIEQPGRIRIIRDGSLLDEPFLDIQGRVGSQGSEQGLLGLAFHPSYEENGYFYVNYTDSEGDTVIARYTVSPENPDFSNPDTEQRLIFYPQPYQNHNGGVVTFGPDGYLYLGLGDGGSAGDPEDRAQDLSTLLGKILRIDVNQGDPYAIPPDNPFVDEENAEPEIWAYGLRNPWRFSFDRATGDLFIGDVGQNMWEEIDYLPREHPGGANFGWDFYEGSHPYEGSPPEDLDLVFPAAEYSHAQGCSVTGGVVYRGQALPEWQGIYLFGDYCSGTVWGMVQDGQGGWRMTAAFDGLGNIASFGEDEQGEVYITDIRGSLLKLVRR